VNRPADNIYCVRRYNMYRQTSDQTTIINKQANKHHTSSGKKMSLVILGTEWNRTDGNATVKG